MSREIPVARVESVRVIRNEGPGGRFGGVDIAENGDFIIAYARGDDPGRMLLMSIGTEGRKDIQEVQRPGGDDIDPCGRMAWASPLASDGRTVYVTDSIKGSDPFPIHVIDPERRHSGVLTRDPRVNGWPVEVDVTRADSVDDFMVRQVLTTTAPVIDVSAYGNHLFAVAYDREDNLISVRSSYERGRGEVMYAQIHRLSETGHGSCMLGADSVAASREVVAVKGVVDYRAGRPKMRILGLDIRTVDETNHEQRGWGDRSIYGEESRGVRFSIEDYPGTLDGGMCFDGKNFVHSRDEGCRTFDEEGGIRYRFFPEDPGTRDVIKANYLASDGISTVMSTPEKVYLVTVDADGLR